MRTYEKTHAWLKFSLDLRQAPASTWITLGECQAKVSSLTAISIPPTVAKELHHLYLAQAALANIAIEGNTLSEQEVLNRLNQRATLPPSREYLVRELDGVLGGFAWVRETLPAILAA